MEQALIELVNSLGVWAVFILLVLEYACFPIPSEIVLPLAGYYASGGRMSFPEILILSIFAGLIGSSALYAVGYYGGRAVLNHVAGKYKGSRNSIHAAKMWFDRYGAGSVLAGRVIPLARTYISLVAGAARMRFHLFIFLSLLGISIWNLALVGLGYYLGANWVQVEFLYSRYKMILLPAAVILLLCLIYRRLKKS
ncbi:MAG TPA: DedA family protein [Firmicutes bacterium]|nr:DedA family protein [Bacillota bacterium]